MFLQHKVILRTKYYFTKTLLFLRIAIWRLCTLKSPAYFTWKDGSTLKKAYTTSLHCSPFHFPEALFIFRQPISESGDKNPAAFTSPSPLPSFIFTSHHHHHPFNFTFIFTAPPSPLHHHHVPRVHHHHRVVGHVEEIFLFNVFAHVLRPRPWPGARILRPKPSPAANLCEDNHGLGRKICAANHGVRRKTCATVWSLKKN